MSGMNPSNVQIGEEERTIEVTPEPIPRERPAEAPVEAPQPDRVPAGV